MWSDWKWNHVPGSFFTDCLSEQIDSAILALFFGGALGDLAGSLKIFFHRVPGCSTHFLEGRLKCGVIGSGITCWFVLYRLPK